jgi:4-hydroxythreonine-4-phosphate dehydrogenase
VGPEISVSAALQFLEEQPNVVITLLGDVKLLEQASHTKYFSERLKVQAVPLREKVKPGVLNSKNSAYVLEILSQAVEGCKQNYFDAMVTAPIQKSIINDAGIPFTGHTEFLAEQCQVGRVVMMLCAALPQGMMGLDKPQNLRVALATTHLPLKEVPTALNFAHVLEVIQIVHDDLQAKFGIAHPRISVAGLNPHAGESGYLGSEEIDTIIPAIEAAKALGINAIGPIPGDTMFNFASLDKVDAYLAMYHDQGLAPFKFVAFSRGVNVTLGLPIIRTSVDHGTALDIAGKDCADASSMLEALRLAYQLAFNQKQIY